MAGDHTGERLENAEDRTYGFNLANDFLLLLVSFILICVAKSRKLNRSIVITESLSLFLSLSLSFAASILIHHHSFKQIMHQSDSLFSARFHISSAVLPLQLPFNRAESFPFQRHLTVTNSFRLSCRVAALPSPPLQLSIIFLLQHQLVQAHCKRQYQIGCQIISV